MIGHLARVFVVVVAIAGILYVVLPQPPIFPTAWTPPQAPSFTGPYAANARLANVERLGAGAGIGPEDVAVDGAGRIYGGLEDGRIVVMQPDGSEPQDFADTGGRPLGLDFDARGNLIVADAYEGLLSIAPDGEIRRLARGMEDRPFRLTNDVDVAPDGRIYFTEASNRFTLADYVLDLLEHQPNGRVLSYDPRSDEVEAVLWPLYFANGVAVSRDGSFLLVAETGRYRVMRLWLQGSRRGESEIFIDNLPGFPDGISSGDDGLFWLALISPRDRGVDWLLPRPTARRLIARLPRQLQPAPRRYSFVLGLDRDGKVAHNLQDPEGGFAQISSVERHRDALYLGSLVEDAIGRIPAP
jgi:sugar lactone lactonase YvrE